MSPSSTPHISSAASYPTPSTVVTSSGLVQTTQPSRLPPLIPGCITDKLVYQQSQMEEMQRQMQRQDDTIETLRNTVDDLSNSRDDFLFEMKDLDAENIHLLQRVDVLENLVRKQTKKIDQLFEMLEDSELHERTKRDKDSKPKATRDNVLNKNTVAMGLPKTSKAKDAAAIRSNKADGGYIKDKETGGRLPGLGDYIPGELHSTWHAKMLEYIRQQAPHHNPALTLAAMNAKSDDEILDRLSSLFKNTSFIMMTREAKPRPEGLRAFLRCIVSHVEVHEILLLASEVISRADHWFNDNELRPVPHEHGMWNFAKTWTTPGKDRYKERLEHYIALTSKIAQIPEWMAVNSEGLPGWLLIVPDLLFTGITAERFKFVLSTVWDVDPVVGRQYGDGSLLAMAYIALTNVLNEFKLSNVQELPRVLRLLECTAEVAFWAQLLRPVGTKNFTGPSRSFQENIMRGLSTAATQAVTNAEAHGAARIMDQASEPALKRAGKLLSKLASKINDELGKEWGKTVAKNEILYWEAMREEFRTDCQARRACYHYVDEGDEE
ncbi:hypothetical protein B0H13DRAFT_2338095 [Mycena leptocephala]|nr:hypothetical protein B0H13DRAFT_2338095 [Mycena leptocephala]